MAFSIKALAALVAITLCSVGENAVAQDIGTVEGPAFSSSSQPGVVREIFVESDGSTYVCCTTQACRFACRATSLQGTLLENQCYRIGQDCVPELDDGAIVADEMDIIAILVGLGIPTGTPTQSTTTTINTFSLNQSNPAQNTSMNASP